MRLLNRALLILFLTVGLASPSWAAVALIGSQANCTSGNLFAGTNSYVYTYPAALTSGSLAVMSVSAENRVVSSISGTGASFAINGVNTNSAGLSRNISLWYAVTTSGGTTATITISGATSATASVCFAEFSGNSSDQSGATANGSDTEGGTASFTSGSVTPPTADNVVVAATDRTTTSAPGWSEDGAFTMVSSADQTYSFGYLIQTSATAQTYDMLSVDNEYAIMRIGAFAGTTSGTPATNFFRLRVNP